MGFKDFIERSAKTLPYNHCTSLTFLALFKIPDIHSQIINFESVIVYRIVCKMTVMHFPFLTLHQVLLIHKLLHPTLQNLLHPQRI